MTIPSLTMATAAPGESNVFHLLKSASTFDSGDGSVLEVTPVAAWEMAVIKTITEITSLSGGIKEIRLMMNSYFLNSYSTIEYPSR
jgi:hypothetical protein